MSFHPVPTLVGRFLVSPLTRQLADGQYAASVSIRSGHGSGTLDRVLRFTRLFTTPLEALHYAADQGHSWVVEPSTR